MVEEALLVFEGVLEVEADLTDKACNEVAEKVAGAVAMLVAVTLLLLKLEEMVEALEVAFGMDSTHCYQLHRRWDM